jgi:hypothetical protein
MKTEVRPKTWDKNKANLFIQTGLTMSTFELTVEEASRLEHQLSVWLAQEAKVG